MKLADMYLKKSLPGGRIPRKKLWKFELIFAAFNVGSPIEYTAFRPCNLLKRATDNEKNRVPFGISVKVKKTSLFDL